MRYFLLLFIICFSMSSKAQFLERVYLKDSITVHEGWIIEQVPQEYLKILRFKTRDTITINVSDIMKISRVIDSKIINNQFKVPLLQKNGFAQSIFMELGGNGPIVTINYDRRFKRSKRDGFGFRAGFGYARIRDTTLSASSIAIPFDVNYLIGKRRNALELGFAFTYFSSRVNGQRYTLSPDAGVIGEGFNRSLIGFINIAYRYRSLNNGFMFKVGLTPVISSSYFTNIGISIGYHFQKK